MKHIFVDFEMNLVSRERYQELSPCHMEIIEIGAVALDENSEEISSFKQYIKPQYNEHIMPRYVAITGITDEVVAESPYFEECFFKFLKWCNSFGENNYEIFAWSGSDLKQLRRELKSKNIDISQPLVDYLLSNWHDYQKEFCKQVGLKQVISLEKAIALIDYNYFRDLHDALCDARNTSMLYSLAQNEQSLTDLKEMITEIKKSVELSKNVTKKNDF